MLLRYRLKRTSLISDGCLEGTAKYEKRKLDIKKVSGSAQCNSSGISIEYDILSLVFPLKGGRSKIVFVHFFGIKYNIAEVGTLKWTAVLDCSQWLPLHNLLVFRLWLVKLDSSGMGPT